MNGAEVLDIGRDAIWLTLQLCAPALIVGLLIGVLVGLLQALTQIQEATVVYAPKIVGIFLALAFVQLLAMTTAFLGQIVAEHAYTARRRVVLLAIGAMVFSGA